MNRINLNNRRPKDIKKMLQTPNKTRGKIGRFAENNGLSILNKMRRIENDP